MLRWMLNLVIKDAAEEAALAVSGITDSVYSEVNIIKSNAVDYFAKKSQIEIDNERKAYRSVHARQRERLLLRKFDINNESQADHDKFCYYTRVMLARKREIDIEIDYYQNSVKSLFFSGYIGIKKEDSAILLILLETESLSRLCIKAHDQYCSLHEGSALREMLKDIIKCGGIDHDAGIRAKK